MHELFPLFYKLPSENIVYLKFIIESHEGIATLRTLNAEEGLVAILGMRSTASILQNIIADISQEIQLCAIDRPKDLAPDAPEDLLIEYLLQ